MAFQEKIYIGEIFYYMAVVVLVLVAPHVESKKEEQESSLAYLVDTGEINQEMIDLLRDCCKLESVAGNRVLQDIELHFKEGRSSVKNIQETVKVFRPLVKQLFLDCIRENNLLLHRTAEDKGSESQPAKYSGFSFTQSFSFRRRNLAQSFGEAPVPSPSVLSTSPSPSISVMPEPQVPESPSVLPFFPSIMNDSNMQQAADESADASDVEPSRQDTSNRNVIIAVAATASMTIFIAALLFLCCRRCGTGSGQGVNDDRPLLSLSLNDYSIASSHKSFNLGTLMNEEKTGNQSFNNKLNIHNISGKSYTESHSLSNLKMENSVGVTAEAANKTTEHSIQMSVGTPGLPPLKPPPGRTDHPKPSLGEPAATLPPAPVPPPPPPIRPSSSGPRVLLPKTPPPPPIPSGIKTGPRPPPPPGAGVPPPRPPPVGFKPPRPVPSQPSTDTSSEESKAKLKPFFWDKMSTNSEDSMVWNQIKSGSFQFNEEMIESLFGYTPAGKNMNGGKKETSSKDPAPQYIQIIDPKKAQNLSILLKALNVTTEEVCDALEEGNELPTELIQTLLKMAPTSEEELKLRLYSGSLSQLGPAERFLKVLVDIPFAFKRFESLLFMCTLQEETSMLKESFRVLEAASTELRKSRLFLKLLEAVLKTGNRMNDGTFRGGAQAFKLDTLLKLADVKGIDGKTTLLHFVVREIIRSEGIRAARASRENLSLSSFKSEDLVLESNQDSDDDHFRSIGLQVVSSVGSELENVKKAAVLDAESITGTVAKLGHSLIKSRDFLNLEMKNTSEEIGFHQTLKGFVQTAEADVMWLLEEEKRISALVKSTSDYFHGSAGKDEGLRLFVIVRDFLIILEKVCKELVNAPQKSSRPSKNDDSVATPAEPRQTAADPRQRLFPAITDRRMESSSSDDES